MKVAAVLTLCLGAASAFAPASTGSRQATVLAAGSSLDGTFGTGVETGGKCPPMGAKILEDAGPEAMKWFQNAEIKHCRIAMVATIGYMVQKLGLYYPLYCGPASGDPWYLSTTTGVTFADISKAAPLDAIGMVPPAGWLQIFFAAGLFESVAYYRQWAQDGADSKVPGDYGYDPLGFTKRPGGWDSEELTKLRMNEIKNGRLAMVAISGWVSEQLIPGSFPVPQP